MDPRIRIHTKTLVITQGFISIIKHLRERLLLLVPRAALRMELPDMIQVPSRSSVALDGKGTSMVLGSQQVTPTSMEPLQELIFLSMRTSNQGWQ
jgi:hypothetical protein